VKAKWSSVLLRVVMLVIALLPAAGVAPDLRVQIFMEGCVDNHSMGEEQAAVKFQTIKQRKCIPVNRGAFLFLRKGGGLSSIQSY